jgi:hypothetical protein
LSNDIKNNNQSGQNRTSNSGKNSPSQTSSGQATDAYGNKIGPSGKQQENIVKHASDKKAADAARAEGKGKPVNHTSPREGNDHYHATDKEGNKIPCSTHHEYDKK